MLRWQPIIGGAYFILAGAEGNGSLIARGPRSFKTADSLKIGGEICDNVNSLCYELREGKDWQKVEESTDHGWFMVATNCDCHWTGKDTDDGRSELVKNRLNKLGREKAGRSLELIRENILYSPLVVFPETVYSALLCPATGFFDAQRLIPN